MPDADLSCFSEFILKWHFVVILNLFQELIIRKGLLNIDKTDSSGFALRMTKNIYRHTEALAEVSIRWGKTQFTHSVWNKTGFSGFALRMKECRSVENYLRVRSLYSTILYRKFVRKMFQYTEQREILFVRIILFTPYNKV